MYKFVFFYHSTKSIAFRGYFEYNNEKWGKVGKSGEPNLIFGESVGETMLTGQYAHTLDPKGRVNFPARLREELGETFIITRGLDNCLFVYSQEEWKLLADKLHALPVSKSAPLNRFFFAGAAEVEPDKQGRVLLPAHLREFAGLEKDVTIAGVSNRAEIWDTERWEKNNQLLTAEAIAGAMDELGF